MTQIVGVPVKLRALLLRRAIKVARPYLDMRSANRLGADFTVAERDEIANTRASFLTSTLNLDVDVTADLDAEALPVLKPGVHLHWGMPDALTVMRKFAPGAGRALPAVPNRWLAIAQRGGDTIVRVYVESDFTYAPGSDWDETVDHDSPLCQFPLSLEDCEALRESLRADGRADGLDLAPFRYVGRQIVLEGTEVPSSAETGQYLRAPLTVAGYGRSTFAGILSNCYNVFSAHIPLAADDLADPAGLQFDVAGWYADPRHDCMSHFARFDSAEFPARLKKAFKWDLADQDVPEVPSRSIFVGHTANPIVAPEDEPEESAVRHLHCNVAVGNSGAEALATLTARRIAVAGELGHAEQVRIDEQIQSFLMNAELSGQVGDPRAEFEKLRHDHAFRPIPAGIHWDLKPLEEAGAEVTGAQRTEAVETLLDWLNRLQRLHNVATQHLKSLRRDLYADFIRYQHAAHASSPLLRWGQGLGLKAAINQFWQGVDRSIGHDDFDLDALLPEASHIWASIEQQMQRIAKLEDATNGMHPGEGDFTEEDLAPFLAIPPWEPEELLHVEGPSLASTIHRCIVAVRTSLAADGLKLVAEEAPRFYTPAEPVLMFQGEDLPAPSRLYGGDPSPMRCVMLDAAQAGLSFDAEHTRLADVSSLGACARDLFRRPGMAGMFGDEDPRRRDAVEMEWQAASYPVQRGAPNRYGLGSDFGPNFISRQFSLQEEAVDLATETLDVGPAEAPARTFSGRAPLVPTASQGLLHRVLDYLGTIRVSDLRGVIGADRPGASDNGQAAGASAVALWLHARPDPADEDPPGDPVAPDAATVSPDSVSGAPVFVAADLVGHPKDASFLERLVAWYRTAPRVAGAPFTTLSDDPVLTALETLRELAKLPVLTQALSGLNDAMLGLRREYQLPFVDLVDFSTTFRGALAGRAHSDRIAGYRRLKTLVADANAASPDPVSHFQPVRSGLLRLLRVHLVDSFGRISSVQFERPWKTRDLLYSSHLKQRDAAPGRDAPEAADRNNDDYIYLPPRLNQAAQLSFRWQDGDRANVGPGRQRGRGPVCGWVVPNLVERSLAIFDMDGGALGSITAMATWEPAPGVRPATAVTGIPNLHLRQLVSFLTRDPKAAARDRSAGSRQSRRDFMAHFVDAIIDSLANIDPHSDAHHDTMAMLAGRPLAVVRAEIGLSLMGPAARDQTFASHSARLYGLAGSGDLAHHFDEVRFPVRLGDHGQVNDGLVGYWIESEDGRHYEDGAFYAPNLSHDRTLDFEGDGRGDPTLPSLRARPAPGGQPAHTMMLAPSAAPRLVTMLMDPRGVVHATPGILPTKAIDIPRHFWVDVIRILSASLLTAPILTDHDHVHVPMAEDNAFAWEWLQRQPDHSWQRLDADPANPDPGLRQQTADAKFAPQRIVEGWLKLSPKGAR